MSILKDINAWRKYRRTAAELRNLPDTVLHDIGVDRHAIDTYARRALNQ